MFLVDLDLNVTYQMFQEVRKRLGQVLLYRQVQVHPRYLLKCSYKIPYFTILVELDTKRVSLMAHKRIIASTLSFGVESCYELERLRIFPK